MNKRQLFNDGWKFSKQEIGTTLENMRASSINWNDVEVPHDWLIYDANNLYEDSQGWYQKIFHIDKLDNKVISIRFEGVYMDTIVYVNGKSVGEWKYGYSTFEFDITDLLRLGENEIIVKVVHQAPNSRWYSGAGIYRNIWLQTTSPNYFVSDGIYITTHKEEDKWNIEIDSELSLADNSNIDSMLIRQTILDSKGNEVISLEENVLERIKKVAKLKDSKNAENDEKDSKDIEDIKLEQEENGLITVTQNLLVNQPSLWNLQSPYLYSLHSELIQEGKVIDSLSQRFGFREIRFDSNDGFFINDKHIKLNGVCMHHDLGALGAAMNKAALRRQLLILQEMGVNAIRTAHNMPSVELMDLADELGILIVSEAFDMWEHPKTEYDYARFFKDWHEKDVASWVRRDRNHPSLIMWSIGNEIPDTHVGERGRQVTINLRNLVEKYDPRKNGFVTFGSNYMAWENTQKAAHEIDLVGYNYAEYLYDNHHEKYPDWVIYGAETSSTVQSRGIYHFPYKQSMVSNEDEQCSSLGNCRVSWGAKSTEQCIIDHRDAKYSLGQFIWTGFDYIGEPTPYQTKNSYFGQIDTAGFKKDSFYMYQSAWTNYRDNPMVHILPYWDFNEGQIIDVRVFSNAPEVELQLNGKSLGFAKIDHEKGMKLSGDWQVPYEQGTLTAYAYDENRNIIAKDEQSSFTDPVSIKLQADKSSLKADGQDLIFVTITTEDKDGNHVANANNRVEIEVTGAGRLVGLDNGNSVDYDQYKGTSRRLFSGKLLAIIAGKHDAGEIHVKVRSKGLAETILTLDGQEAKIPEGFSKFLMENTKSQVNDDIEIRKIELISSGEKQLNKDLTSVKIIAKIHPDNASHKDLDWKLINSHGIETNIAELEVNDNEVLITAKGDGDFRLRCSTKNGTSKTKLISELEYETGDLGNIYMNPYGFILGGLYSDSNTKLASGLEQGVATLTNKDSHITFRNIDFGEFGSDTITIPIFCNSDATFPIQIWEGMPGEEKSQLIDTVTYQAKPIWHTYQENTFKLPKKLKGVTTICFVFNIEMHMKGFVFKELEKAYEKLLAIANDNIFGDSFLVKEDRVENIGNNVVLEYKDMDFKDRGFSKIKICGRSNIDINTIHVRFSGEGGDTNQIVEFPYSKDYVEREFKLEGVEGKQTVSLVFLPGSNFDLKWFKFE